MAQSAAKGLSVWDKCPSWVIPPHSGIEEDLGDFFAELVAGLDLERVAARINKNRPIRNLESFGFIALSPHIDDGAVHHLTRSLASSGYVELAITHPEISFCTKGAKAYRDCRDALGLTYNKKLIALGGGGIGFGGNLEVVQLQDVTGVQKVEKEDPGYEAYKSTGLNNRLLWRHTLVRAWQQIGFELGASEIEVQAWQNNVWRGSVMDDEHGEAGYDKVASDLGFVQDDTTRDWVHNITPVQDQFYLYPREVA